MKKKNYCQQYYFLSDDIGNEFIAKHNKPKQEEIQKNQYVSL